MKKPSKTIKHVSVIFGMCFFLVLNTVFAEGDARSFSYLSDQGQGDDVFIQEPLLADSSRALWIRVKAMHKEAKFYRSIGNLDSSEIVYEEMLLLFSEGNGLLKAEVLFELGQVYELQGHPQEAIEAMYASMEQFRTLRSDSGEAVVNEAVAIMHWKQQKPELALDGLLKSFEFKKSQGDSAGMGRSYILIGNMYAQQGRFEAAADYFRLSAAIWKTLDHPLSTVNYSITLNNLGNVFSALSRYSDAEKFYLESIEIKSEIGDSLGLADAYNNVGDFYYQNGEYEKALSFFEQSAQWVGSIAARPKEVVVLENQAIALQALGRFEEALKVLWKRNTLNETLLEDKYSKEVAELLEKFEAEKKDHQINELRTENQLKVMALDQARTKSFIWLVGSVLLVFLLVLALLAVRQHKRKNNLLNEKNGEIEYQRERVLEKNQKLEQITATKDRLFSIIAHNLKGPLSALEGISGIMNHYQETNQTEKLDQVVTEIDKTAFHTNALIDNLLNWARVQTQTIPHQPRDLDIRGVLSQCLELVSVQANVKGISTTLSIHREETVLADLNFLKTIMTNLLHNAIKFTQKGGSIEVETTEVDGRIAIVVRDSGVGIPAEKIKSLFEASATKSTEGTNGEKGTGLGLYVCYEFVEKEGGQLEVSSQPGKGTTFNFTLAKAIDEETP